MSELKFNESKMEHKLREKDIIDQHAITDMEPDIESIKHNEHKMQSGEQAEDTKIRPGTFSMDSFLKRFKLDIDNNGQSSPDNKENQTNILKNKKEGHGASVTDKEDIKAQQEQKSESQASESNDQQSHRLSSSLEQYGSSPLKAHTENVQPVTKGNTGYKNILEELYDDEDLQYILNITHNLDSMRQSTSNETLDELYVEELSAEDVIDITDLEGATNIKEERVKENDAEPSRDDIEIQRENLVGEETGVNTGIIFDDLVMQQKESATEEQQEQQTAGSVNVNRIRGDVPDDDYSIEMTTIAQNDKHTEKTTTALPSYLENSSDRHMGAHEQDVDVPIQKKEGRVEINSKNLSADACDGFRCKRGKMCKTDEHGNPFCTCQDPDSCLPGNRNDLVCGTDNKTYTSACHLFGTKCQFEGTKEGTHLHLDYQGPCKYIPPCTEYELAHFPFRMRDWLKNVLMQLYERDQENIGLLSEKQKNKVKKIYENERRLQEGDHNIELLVKDFQKNYHMYVYPVHWQFHQLDQHSMDRLLTRSELAALRAPLIPNEHCVNAFLKECNTNNDREISLWEWCRCFGIKEDDINEDLLF